MQRRRKSYVFGGLSGVVEPAVLGGLRTAEGDLGLEDLCPEFLATCFWSPAFTGKAVQPDENRLAESFGEVIERRYLWSIDCTAFQYVELLRSLPELGALPTERQSRLFTQIGAVVQAAGGTLPCAYESRLYVAR